MLIRAQRALALASSPHNSIIARFFAKEAPKKDGKKDDKPAAPAVVQETPLVELAMKWINPTRAALSPSQLKLYKEGFEDLSASDKEILNDFAERLLELPTAIFYDTVFKKGSLGTSQLYYTAVDPLPETELLAQIQGIRKEL